MSEWVTRSPIELSWTAKKMQIAISIIIWINSHPLRLSRRHWRRTYRRKHQSQHQRSQPCNQRQFFFQFLRISHHFKSTPIFQFFMNISLLLQLGTNLIVGHCPIVICQLKRKYTIEILFLNIRKGNLRLRFFLTYR